MIVKGQLTFPPREREQIIQGGASVVFVSNLNINCGPTGKQSTS